MQISKQSISIAVKAARSVPSLTLLFFIRFDLEDAFGRYGRVKAVWIARRPPGFGFVEMEDSR